MRTPRPLSAPSLVFDFDAEAARLRTEAPWLEHGSNAVTLVKYPDLRIVFMLMKQGNRMKEHQTGGTVSLQTLSGHVRLHLKDQVIDLGAGRMLALEGKLAHDVEALEDSSLLLTIAWTDPVAPPDASPSG